MHVGGPVARLAGGAGQRRQEPGAGEHDGHHDSAEADRVRHVGATRTEAGESYNLPCPILALTRPPRTRAGADTRGGTRARFTTSTKS